MSKQILEKFAGKSCWAVTLWCLFLILVPDCLIALGAEQTLNSDTRGTVSGPKKDGRSSFPKIIIDEKVFNFKTVYEGEPIVHTFTVKNGGSDTLVIEKVKPS
ncbi:MAG: DUF1573 domain-containing protein [Deltaproteobacteria bacterium]|nr:DUF1573 domain-containing protein [Deltaproteobacteria bacterium]